MNIINGKIQNRAVAWVVIIITLCLSLFGLGEYIHLKRDLSADMVETSEITGKRLSKNLADPIFNMQGVDHYREIMVSEMMPDKRLYAVVLEEEFIGKLIMRRNEEWEPIQSDDDFRKTGLLEKKFPIKDPEAGKLGEVKVYYTDRFLKQTVQEDITDLVFQILILDIIMAVSLFLIIRRIIVRPLEKIMADLNLSSRDMENIAREVSHASNAVAEDSSQQASSLQETSSSLEELLSMTRQNAENAQSTDGLMKENLLILNEARNVMSELEQSMSEMIQVSDEATKIIKNIDEISFQTNLLALNAAIEAARAGEAGAGFAVVSEEVRNLALRASKAAKNTATLVEEIVKKINEGSSFVEKNTECFSRVSHSSDKIAGIMAEIASATDEQSQGIEQINKAVAEMDQLTQQNAANSEETAAASHEMFQHAEKLNGHIIGLNRLIQGHEKSKGNREKLPINHSMQKAIPRETAIMPS